MNKSMEEKRKYERQNGFVDERIKKERENE
jgi:hypothetical protein